MSSTTKKPFTSIVVELRTPAGLAMQPALTEGFAKLECPANETCLLVVGDMAGMPGVTVLLKRQKFVLKVKGWVVDHDPQTGTYFYNGLFEKESAEEIIAAIKNILEMP
jgi:hypothetical protein